LDRQDLAGRSRRETGEQAAAVGGWLRRLGCGVRCRFVTFDAGSCNGCEIEISGAFGPVYDAERFGAPAGGLAAGSADALLVTGLVTHKHGAGRCVTQLRPHRNRGW